MEQFVLVKFHNLSRMPHKLSQIVLWHRRMHSEEILTSSKLTCGQTRYKHIIT